MTVISGLLLKGAISDGKDNSLRDALVIVAVLFGLFVASRIFSFIVDGPPNNSHVHMIWGSELAGTIFAVVLLYLGNVSGNTSFNSKNKK